MKAKNFFKRGVFALIAILLTSLIPLRTEANDTVTMHYVMHYYFENGDSGAFVIKNFNDVEWVTDTTSSTFTISSTEQGILSDIKAIEINQEEDTVTTLVTNLYSEKALEVYPNPSDGNFTVKSGIKTTENTYIDVISISGAILKSVKLPKNAQSFSYSFNQSMPSGTYICRLRNQNQMQIAKIIINK